MGEEYADRYGHPCIMAQHNPTHPTPATRLGFRPRLLSHLPNYSRQTLLADCSAGITVAFVALPLAMSFAIASGLPPQAGLITAIVAGFLISALGGSSVQIGGPAGAFIVVVYTIVERYGVPNLLISTACAGLLMMAMGALRLGGVIRLIPISIVSGFTSGIAVLIALSQIKEFLGLAGPALPAEFFAKCLALWRALPSLHLETLGLGLACLALILLWPASNRLQAGRISRSLSQIPGSLIAIGASTAAVSLLGLPIETVGERFGPIPTELPVPTLPEMQWSTVQFLLPPILTIAFLGAIESLLCARVADGLHKERHDPNQELMAQGVANLASPLFGGFCATGTIARTVTNIRAGAQTPVAGIVHALTLLVIVLGAAPLAEQIPLVSLAAVALVVAYHMGDWQAFRELRTFSLPYRVTLLSTFVLTVVIDITVAVEVGLLLAALFFIIRMSQLTRVDEVPVSELQAERLDNPEVAVYRVSGVLFFAAVTKLEPLLDPQQALPRMVVLDLAGLLVIDSTGVDALKTLDESLAGRGVELRLTHLQPEVLATLSRWGLLEHFGPKRVFPTLRGAMDRV